MDKNYSQVSRLNNVLSEINGLYHDLAQHLGVSDSVLGILYTAQCHGGACSLRQICLLTGMSKQTLNSALRKMEAEGLLSLQAVDGKQKKVCLTPAGKELASRTAVVELDLETSILDNWGPEETEAFLRLNERYLQCLRQGLSQLKESRFSTQFAAAMTVQPISSPFPEVHAGQERHP